MFGGWGGAFVPCMAHVWVSGIELWLLELDSQGPLPQMQVFIVLRKLVTVSLVCGSLLLHYNPLERSAEDKEQTVLVSSGIG